MAKSSRGDPVISKALTDTLNFMKSDIEKA